jgi:hypothetical protein
LGLPTRAAGANRRGPWGSDASAEVIAQARIAEPRLGYAGLLIFTAVLLLRPQDHPQLRVLHLAELALRRHRTDAVRPLARGGAVFRLTPEIGALIAFGMIMVGTVPFSVWPGGALRIHRFVSEGARGLRADGEHPDDSKGSSS